MQTKRTPENQKNTAAVEGEVGPHNHHRSKESHSRTPHLPAWTGEPGGLAMQDCRDQRDGRRLKQPEAQSPLLNWSSLKGHCHAVLFIC